LIHLKPLSWDGGPITLLDSSWLEIQGPTHLLQVVGKGLDSLWVVPDIQGALSVRLVIGRTIIIIVPLIMSLLLIALRLLAPVIDPATCISTADDVAQVSVILVTALAMLLRWSEAAVRVPTQTLPVVKLMTPYFTTTVEDRVNHGCYI
jgi:hypothetical protein